MDNHLDSRAAAIGKKRPRSLDSQEKFEESTSDDIINARESVKFHEPSEIVRFFEENGATSSGVDRNTSNEGEDESTQVSVDTSEAGNEQDEMQHERNPRKMRKRRNRKERMRVEKLFQTDIASLESSGEILAVSTQISSTTNFKDKISPIRALFYCLGTCEQNGLLALSSSAYFATIIKPSDGLIGTFMAFDSDTNMKRAIEKLQGMSLTHQEISFELHVEHLNLQDILPTVNLAEASVLADFERESYRSGRLISGNRLVQQSDLIIPRSWNSVNDPGSALKSVELFPQIADDNSHMTAERDSFDTALEPVSVAGNIVADRLKEQKSPKAFAEALNHSQMSSLMDISEEEMTSEKTRDSYTLSGPLKGSNAAAVGQMRLKDLSLPERMLQTRYWRKTGLDELVKCPRCAEDGHMEDLCPARTCSICGAYDEHYTGLCPRNRRCTNCREHGHSANECRSLLRRSKADGFTCDLCQGNHPEEVCSWIWRTFDPKKSLLSQKSDLLISNCYNCGSNRHFGGDCPSAMPHSLLSSTNDTFSWSFAQNFFLGPPADTKSAGFAIRGRARDQPIVIEDELPSASNFLGRKVHGLPPRPPMRFTGLATRQQQDSHARSDAQLTTDTRMHTHMNDVLHHPLKHQSSLSSSLIANKLLPSAQPPLPNEPLPPHP